MLKIVSSSEHGKISSAISGWVAEGRHSFGEEDYKSPYLFAFKGVALDHFLIWHEVKGPVDLLHPDEI